jgi:tRNA(Ile)-lysidine synthase
MTEIQHKVHQANARHELITSGEKVLVALSGGPDSVALVTILVSLKRKLGIQVGAVYIDHHLRPKAVKKEIAFCRELCATLKILFFCEEIDIPRKAQLEKSGIEETARKYRYQILEMVADREGFDKIAVGHHRDDRVETIIFNLARGAGRQGIIGMPPKRGRIVRPLYDVSREEIETYLRDRKLSWMTDRSNADVAFARNRIRNSVVPLLKKELSPSAPENIIRFSEIIAGEDKYLQAIVDDVYAEVVSCTPGGKFKLDLNGRFGYDIWLLRRLFFELLGDAGLFDIEYNEIERLIGLISAGVDSSVQLRDGLLATLSGNDLYVQSPGKKITPTVLPLPGEVRLSYPRYQIESHVVKATDAGQIKKSSCRFAIVDADHLAEPLVIGGIRPGARFHPFGRPGSKKIGDFLTDKKYPRPLRDELPVIYDQNGVVWVTGFEIDHRMRVTDKTKRIIRFEIRRY